MAELSFDVDQLSRLSFDTLMFVAVQLRMIRFDQRYTIPRLELTLQISQHLYDLLIIPTGSVVLQAPYSHANSFLISVVKKQDSQQQTIVYPLVNGLLHGTVVATYYSGIIAYTEQYAEGIKWGKHIIDSHGTIGYYINGTEVVNDSYNDTIETVIADICNSTSLIPDLASMVLTYMLGSM